MENDGFEQEAEDLRDLYNEMIGININSINEEKYNELEWRFNNLY